MISSKIRLRSSVEPRTRLISSRMVSSSSARSMGRPFAGKASLTPGCERVIARSEATKQSHAVSLLNATTT